MCKLDTSKKLIHLDLYEFFHAIDWNWFLVGRFSCFIMESDIIITRQLKLKWMRTIWHLYIAINFPRHSAVGVLIFPLLLKMEADSVV